MSTAWPSVLTESGVTSVVHIHISQIYLTELPILLNPLFPSCWILDKLNFFKGPVNFEITRVDCTDNCKYVTCLIIQIVSYVDKHAFSDRGNRSTHSKPSTTQLSYNVYHIKLFWIFLAHVWIYLPDKL